MNRQSRSYTRTLIASALCTLLSTSAMAQSQCGPSTPDDADRLFAAYFTPSDSRTEGFRARLGLVRQDPSAPHGAVADETICRRLRLAVMKQLGDVGEHVEDTDAGDGSPLKAAYRFYRLGDYYGVAYRPRPKTSVRVRGAFPVYIFAVKDLRYKGRIFN